MKNKKRSGWMNGELFENNYILRNITDHSTHKNVL